MAQREHLRHNNLLLPLFKAGKELREDIGTLSTPDWHHFFYRTAIGVELDLIMEKGRRRIALERKASSAPKPDKGFWQAIDDLAITEVWLIAPIYGTYLIEKNVHVGSIADFLGKLAAEQDDNTRLPSP